MPRRAKPARLWLRPADESRQSVWIILDQGRQISTGCPAEDVAGAERALARHTGTKYDPKPGRGLTIPIAEILSVYLNERVPGRARPDHLTYTAESVGKWWGDKLLSDVRLKTCDDYVTWRRSHGVGVRTAWHDLKTLRSAINYWHAAYGPLPAVPVVTLPTPPPGRVRWLRRHEAAKALLAARRINHAARHRYHNTWGNEPYTADHMQRMLMIGLYTGSRPGAILALSWRPSEVGGWIDLDNGIIHRRGEAEDESNKRRPIVRIHSRLLSFLHHWRGHDLDRGITSVIHYKGAPITKLRRSWKSVISDAGLGQLVRGARGRDKFASDVTPHVLRHTCATWLLQAGVPSWEAAGFVGMSEDTLLEVYGHHSPDFQQNAARASNRRTPRKRPDS